MSTLVQPPCLFVDPGRIEPFDRGSGVVTHPYIGKWNSAQTTITTGITAFDVGTGLPLHSHNVEESVLILEGLATAQIGDDHVDLVSGNATWVPAGVPHRFLNRGDTLMRIYWVYGGRDVTRTITATGETFAHLSDADRGGIACDARGA
jgi:mannose-6-phosphate isomerase-like protein (cupin superfamily)